MDTIIDDERKRHNKNNDDDNLLEGGSILANHWIENKTKFLSSTNHANIDNNNADTTEMTRRPFFRQKSLNRVFWHRL